MKNLSFRKIFLFIVGALVVANIAVILWPSETNDDSGRTSRARRRRLPLVSATNAPSVARSKIDAARQAMVGKTPTASQNFRISAGGDEEDDWVDEDGNPWPQDQKQLMRAILQALDDNDFAALTSLTDLVMECPNAEIRERFVEDLGWFGEQAVPELMGFMADKNEDVAQAARDQWIDGVQNMDDDAEKSALLINVGKIMTDSEALETFADELMGMDELLALQTIVDTIDTGTPQAVKAVKDMYETITGEEWSDVEAAEDWLQKNYTYAEEVMSGTMDGDAGDSSEAGGDTQVEGGLQ